MLLEIHMLKNYPATNLNRDETGAPKTCMFGGVQRGRISSQCLKHSWRTSALLKEALGEDMIGIRTRKLPEIIEEALKKQDFPEEYIAVITKTLTGFGTKDGKENSKELKTAQIIAYSPEDVREITALIVEKLKECENVADVKKIKATDLQDILKKNSNRSVALDIALFGRMVTSDAFADVEASMQVAHAVSVNRMYMESDYFTAVDDLIAGSDTETGSAMIGDIDYNSSCYYIYASLDTDKLKDNLKYCDHADEVVKKAIPALIETMVYVNPSGKQNSFAGHSLPSAILIECKEKHIPVSYANAYEVPVKSFKDSGVVAQSVEKLRDECIKISNCYGIPVEKRLWFATKPEIRFEDDFTINCGNFMELIEQLPQI